MAHGKTKQKVGFLEALLGFVKLLVVGAAIVGIVVAILGWYVNNLKAYQDYVVGFLVLWVGALTAVFVFTRHPKALEWVNKYLKLP